MNKNILLSICLLLISMAGGGCVSAADTTNTSMSQIVVEENIDQKKDVASNANNNFITNIPNKKFEKNQNNNKIVTKNNTKNKNTPGSNITGPKIKPNLNITGPKIKNGDDYLGIKGPKINPPEKYTLVDSSKSFNYKGEKVCLALVENNGKQKFLCVKSNVLGSRGGISDAHSASLNLAGSGVVGDTLSDIARIIEDTGLINKAAYYTGKLQVKMALWISDMDASDEFIEYWAYKTAFENAFP